MDKPTVLLLDEPSNDIDISTLELLERLINGWKHIVLFISHDETLIENTANVVIHIEQIMRKTKSTEAIIPARAGAPPGAVTFRSAVSAPSAPAIAHRLSTTARARITFIIFFMSVSSFPYRK